MAEVITTNGEQGAPEKTFTQAELEAKIEERIQREGIRDMKDIVSTLQELGYQGTPAEIKAEVKRQADEYKAKQALEEAKLEAERTGTSPELMAEIKALKQELEELKKDKKAAKEAEEARKATKERVDKWAQEFGDKYPDIDLDKLMGNERFKRFFQKSNPNLSFVEVYDEYKDLVGEVEAVAVAKVKSNADRSTSSGRDKGDSSGGTYGLNARQQEIAKEGGMTFKEYADALAHIRK